VEGVERRVGDGAETLFLSDSCLGGVPFCVRSKRLYDMSLHRSRSASDMQDSSGSGRGSGARNYCLARVIECHGSLTTPRER
jgi:hypothetical protein